ncbi:trypsin-2-like [Microplitis demolitor]|uniref:trypsin-2-like n=1 Tax=Microplitis demolitor TaxID=69319 RepID=UPI0004CCBBF0|nr:trypsin-2-like [Microplitis demolitor]
MLKLIVLFIFSVVAADPLRNNVLLKPNARIIGGQDAVIEDFPYQVNFLYNGFNSCGGAIIAKNWVLTTASCPVEYGMIVHAGSNVTNAGGSYHTVARVMKHEAFKVNVTGVSSNNIDLVKVYQPFVFDKTRQPIPLFNVNEEVEPGTLATVAGWGQISNEEYILTSYNLISVSVPIVPNDQCDELLYKFGGLSKGLICAGYLEDGKNACQGDGGSPLVVDGRAAGLVSWGRGCALPNYPVTYTSIAAYRSWIDGKLQATSEY